MQINLKSKFVVSVSAELPESAWQKEQVKMPLTRRNEQLAMRNQLKFLIFFAIAISIVGCVSPQSIVPSDFRYVPGSKKGVVLVSIIEADYDNAWPGGRRFPMLQLFKKGGGFESYFSSYVYGTNNEMGRRKHIESSDYDGKRGNLLAVILEEGSYKITEGVLPFGYTEMWISGFGPIVFEVNAGEVTYLGSFEFYLGRGAKNVFGVTPLVPDAVIIKDSEEDDFLLFYKRYPQLRGVPVRKQVNVREANEHT